MDIKNLFIYGFICFEYKEKGFRVAIRNLDETDLDLDYVEVWSEKDDGYLSYDKFDYETIETYNEAIEKIKKIFIKNE